MARRRKKKKRGAKGTLRVNCSNMTMFPDNSVFAKFSCRVGKKTGYKLTIRAGTSRNIKVPVGQPTVSCVGYHGKNTISAQINPVGPVEKNKITNVSIHLGLSF